MSDSQDDITAPGFQIKLNGSALSDDLAAAIHAVQVQFELNQPAMFSFDLDTFDSDTGDWRGLDLKTFRPGATVEISMGLDELKPLIKGEITALDPVFDSDYSYMSVRGFDPLYRLRFGTRLHAYTNMTDNAIVKYIAGKQKLTAIADAPTTKYDYILQNNISDFDFLLGRAGRIGYEVLIQDSKLYFRKCQEGKSPVVEMTFGEDLQKFSARLRALTSGSRVEVRGWDQKQDAAFSAVASNGSEISRMGGQRTGFAVTTAALPASPITLPYSGVVSPNDASSVAKAVYNAELNEFLEGDAACDGNPLIRAGVNVRFANLGGVFNGLYYVTGAVHKFDDESGYFTEFNVRRTAV